MNAQPCANIAKGDTPVTEYMVTDGTYYNGQCCIDFGNAEMQPVASGDGTDGSNLFRIITLFSSPIKLAGLCDGTPPELALRANSWLQRKAFIEDFLVLFQPGAIRYLFSRVSSVRQHVAAVATRPPQPELAACQSRVAAQVVAERPGATAPVAQRTQPQAGCRTPVVRAPAAAEVLQRAVSALLVGSLHRLAEAESEPAANRQQAEGPRWEEPQLEGFPQRAESPQWEERQLEGFLQRAESLQRVVPQPVEAVPQPVAQQLAVRVGLSEQRHPWVGIRGTHLIAAQAIR